MDELKQVILELSNIIKSNYDDGSQVNKDNIIESIKNIVDNYNTKHEKKINY